MAYNSELLKNRIDESGVKLKFLAIKLGISPYGLKLKLDGINEFKNSEIINISDALNLTAKERDSIFFS